MTEKAQQYREVRRKAAVGERIKIVDGGVRFSSGSVFVVEDADFPWGGDDRDGTGVAIDGGKPLSHRRYVVLEPIAQLIAETTPVSPLTSDPLYAAFRQFVADNAPALRKLLAEVDPETAAVTAPVIPKLTRAQVIAKARADVAEITANLKYGNGYKSGVEGDNKRRHLNVEFHVNREKRAVNVIVRGQFSGNIRAKATAKCSPADVFHAEIGKAIALRRALGLSVPDEYVNAPKPDEPRVGAIVNGGVVHAVRPTHRTVGSGAGCRFSGHEKGYTYIREDGFEWWDHIASANILDDTDVDYGLAEGVAA